MFLNLKELVRMSSSDGKDVLLQGFSLINTYDMLLLPNCKINIGLNVVARRADGYHDLETVFYPVPLRDNLELKVLDEDVDYRFVQHGVKVDGEAKDNLVTKEYLSLKEEFDLPALDIFLYKNIPLGAGLGGGSSDAAFMMQGVNEYFNLGLTTEDMEQRVAKFGADCAFFIKNTPAYATGIGDKLSPINLSLKDKYILLVKPDVFVSTKEAYAHVTPRPADYPLLKAIEQPIECWRERIVNDFEQSVFPNHPELAAIKQTLYDMGALYAAMSGSGSTLFGLFDRPIDEGKKVFSQHFVFMQKLAR